MLMPSVSLSADCTVYPKNRENALDRVPATEESAAALVWLPIDTLTWGGPGDRHRMVEIDPHLNRVAALVGAAARGRPRRRLLCSHDGPPNCRLGRHRRVRE